MTSVTTEVENGTEAESSAQDVTAQDAPVEATQRLTDEQIQAKLSQAEADSPVAFGLMTMIVDKYKEFLELDKQFKEIRKQGEVPVRTLLEGITDDENATNLANALKQVEERVEAIKAKARELLAAKGLTNDAAEGEVSTKRTEARSGLSKATSLFDMVLSTNPDFQAKYGDFAESFKVRASSGTGGTTSNEDLAKIREWAKTKGIKVADRGRISGDVVKAYHEANATTA